MTALWTALMLLAVLWPSKAAGPLDGAPLDAAPDALIIGLVIPALWCLHRRAVTEYVPRFAIIALLGWKAATGVTMTQQGLCVAMSAGEPLSGINQGVPIEEPSGALRSWDVRADWRAPEPQCTAIVTRRLREQREFPAWFLNVTSQLKGSKDVLLHATGVVSVGGNPSPVDVRMTLVGDTWSFDPTLNGASIWAAGLVTTSQPNAIDRIAGAWAWMVTAALVVVLVGSLAWHSWKALTVAPAMAIASAVLASVTAVMASLPNAAVQRLAALLLFAAVVFPTPSHLRNRRGAFLLIGIPWLAFIAVLSLSQIGRFTLYSYDDWLAYQVASHRIYFQGYWLEGGNEVFDFQPLYRWMTGALHLVFGDSSVGELYWDAGCILVGALLAFQLARGLAGFRFALAAAAATIATMTVGTPWYFLGRGLSEIAAAGWGFAAMFLLLRGRRGSPAWAVAAGAAATLMFYTRLNHLLFALFLPVFLLPTRTSMTWSRLAPALARIRLRAAAGFIAAFAAGVCGFALRTWHYTGVFSLFHGTSLRHNDTGLRPWTLFEAGVWSRVSHSLLTTVFMNEPPRPDPRAFVAAGGAGVAALALLWRRFAAGIPAIAVIAAAGGTLGSFFAHAHGYPGRFTIHLLPFASVLVMTGASTLLHLRARRPIA